MVRRGKVIIHKQLAGWITELEDGYIFEYDETYLSHPEEIPVSLTLPLQKESFKSKTMIPFFDGLIPEGWLLEVAHQTWKIDPRDRMGLLLSCCKDCIGAVSVLPVEDDENG